MRRKTLWLVLTNLVSLACLIWVLHGVDWAELRADIKGMAWGWLTVAVIGDIGVYVWQGYRWSLLLAPVERVPVWRSVRAIYVGLFANELLPFRSGEVIRCYLQARWSTLPFSVTLSSAVIERVFDGLWLILGLLVTVQFVELPAGVVRATTVLAGVVAIAALLLGLVMFHRQHAHAVLAGRKWFARLRVLIDDLHTIGRSPLFYAAAAASLPFLLLQVIPFWAMLKADRFEGFTPLHAFVILVVVRLGTALPQAPGNLGTFHALVVTGLKLFGIDQSVGKPFSLILWSVITLPLLAGGFVALVITGVRLAELRRRATAEMGRNRWVGG